MPEENVERIKEWAAKNPDFETYLWIDKKTTSKEKLEEYYSRYHFNEIPKIVLKDISEENVVDEYSRYHIDKLKPNYGASSDLLRYSILKKYGGVYFDSDVIVTEESKPLNYAGLFDSDEKEILRINHFTQNHNAIGNDAFICTPGHPFMADLYEQAKNNHSLNVYCKSPYSFHDLESVTTWTIKTTGAGVLLQVCIDREMIDKSGINKTKDPSFFLDRSCYEPASHNDINWLKALPRKCNDLDECIRITLETIQFEVKHLRMLAIDYHISEIVRSLGLKSTLESDNVEPTEDEIKVSERLIQMLSNTKLYLANCNVIQLITRYKKIADYYYKFTPMLVDGDIIGSEKEIYDLCFHKQKNYETSEMIIYNYFSHLFNQLNNEVDINRVLSNKKCNSPLEERIRHHVIALIDNYVANGGDLALIENNLPGLCKFNFHKVNWIKSLIDFLIKISKISTEENASVLKNIINDHLIKYPGHRKSILYTLSDLHWDRVVLDGEKIRLSDETANRISKIRDELYSEHRAASRVRKKLSFFQQSDEADEESKEAEIRSKIISLR